MKILFFSNLIIRVQQGNPLSPALFSLGIHKYISNLKLKLNIWYLDDGTIGSKIDDVVEDLFKVKNEFDKIGFKLNFSTCEFFFTDHLSLPKIW